MQSKRIFVHKIHYPVVEVLALEEFLEVLGVIDVGVSEDRVREGGLR